MNWSLDQLYDGTPGLNQASQIEEVLGHLPEDLDARFAGVDTKLAQIREVQALHTTRFSTLERKLDNSTQAWGFQAGCSTRPSAPSPTTTSSWFAARAPSTISSPTMFASRARGRACTGARSSTQA